ncbi:transglycosylase domain-containing protein [Lacisediminihabitans changchengi]|uniref:Transglycosylase domain-containing protein n=1 Tax=Lacisediminihabitans changchengi TaxID=2787634 RepID=A0A934SLA9_9MICO|nr:transglycosylase domain-containing protein [Lacisediminihabitans changchengi]MBK4348802.1 transglycosylase domain-containing protein [Lacisediminihabitans changchengi]
MSAQKLKPLGALGALVGLVGFSVIAGVLVTAMVTPALAVTSMTAQSGISIFENLPENIKIGQLSQQNEIYAKRGDNYELLAKVFKQNREEVGADEVSQFLKDAAVDGEDRRFRDHGGVDVPSIARAVVNNASSSNTQGSSTLDMQLVRNILTSQTLEISDPKERAKAYKAVTDQNASRKLREMKLAIGLDKKYTKDQILLAYLNIINMGYNTYGVQAAAQQYFNTNAKDITLAEAASLIAIVQRPSYQNLTDPKYYAANKLRRDQILAAMLDEKHITQAQYTEAVNTPIESYVKITPPSSGCRAVSVAGAGFACDYALKVITSQLAENTPNAAPAVKAIGATPAERVANWDKGGYKVYLSLDLDLQQAAQDAVNLHTPPDEQRFKLGSAAVSVEVGTGRIVSMALNKTFDDAANVPGAPVDVTKGAVNWATDKPYGGSNGFNTGSTYKVVDLADYLSNGGSLGDVINGTGPQTYKLSSFKCNGAPLSGSPFTLNNDGKAREGVMTVKNALMRSVNNAFMNMALKQDLCSGIAATAKKMGAHLAVMDGVHEYGTVPSTILGVNEQSPLTVAGWGATIGSGGTYCTPTIIDKVVDPKGKEQAGQAKDCSTAITSDVAAGVANAMVGSETGGTSKPGNPNDGVAIAGKTGTASFLEHDWTLATTTKVATAVWEGNYDGAQISLKKFTNPQTRENYYSSSRFAIIKQIMKTANTMPQFRGDKSFPAASDAVLQGKPVTVPNTTGLTADLAKSLLTSNKFEVADGGPEASALPVGRVTRTDPASGSKSYSGATITYFTSDGSLATAMPTVVGQTRHAALQALSGAGITGTVSITWVAGQVGSGGNICQVRESNPAAGATMSKTDGVTLTVYGTPAGADPGPLCP